MKNKKTNVTITTLLLTLFAFTNVMSQVDSSFTYQGELLDNGSPANGQYDINLDLIDGDFFPWGDTSEHSPVEVVNGLFSVNADFDISNYDGYKDVTVTVSVRKTSEGPGGAFTVLGSQTIQAVPLATNLTNGSATSGQVLTFNGFQWSPADPVASSPSPWNTDGSSISYSTGPVNIGNSTDFILASEDGLNVGTTSNRPATFRGGNNMYVFFEENGQGRGYVGSFQTPGGGILDEDFEIGTTGGSAGNLHLVTGSNEPRLTVDADGLIGIGQINPSAKLQVDSIDDTEDPLRVRVGSTSKLWVKGDGSTNFFGDTKQNITSNGQMKFMVSVPNCGTASPSIDKSYNGIANSTSTITVADGANTGECIIDFPNTIDDRFWQATALGVGGRGVNCTQNGIASDKLSCTRFNTSTGGGVAGSIMVLVY